MFRCDHIALVGHCTRLNATLYIETVRLSVSSVVCI